MNKILSSVASAAVLAGLLLSISGCGKKAPAKKGPGMAMPKAIVQVGKVTLADEIQKRRYTGQVVSRSSVRIVTRVSGEILEIGFRDGSLVKEGQLLYRLDPIQYQAAAKNAEAKVAESKAIYNYAKKNHERKFLLFKKKAASQDAVESTQSILQTANANVLAAEAELIRANDNLKNTRIISPITGITGVTNFTKGNYITPSSGVLVSIIQTQPLRVRFSISTADYLSMFGSFKKLKELASVRVTLSNGQEYPEEGKIELLNNEANEKTDSILVYAEFQNPDHKLVVGSTLNVTLSKKTSRQLPAISPSALMHDSQGSYVYVPDEKNIVRKRYVVAGNTTGNYQLIVSGLKPGEKVVTLGTHKTMPGAEIIPQMEK